MQPPQPAPPPEGAVNDHGETEVLPGGATATHWFAQAAGTVWHVVTTGHHDHTPVLFLHGWPGTWYAWHHQLAGLSDRFACIGIDMKGAGQSGRGADTPWDDDGQAAEVLALLDALTVDRVALVAHGAAAAVADRLCASPGWSRRITAYIRLEPPGHPDRWARDLLASPGGLEAVRSGSAVDLAYGVVAPDEAPVTGAPSIAHPVDPGTVARIKAETTLPGVAEASAARFSSPADHDPEALSAVAVPVLFLLGAHDPRLPAEPADVVDLVPEGFLQLVEAGALPHLEAPTEVSSAVAAFLEAK